MKLTLRSVMAALTLAVLSGACNLHVSMASERLDQSDKDSIREARQDLNDALATRDVERYRSYWLKDASVMWADGDLRVGVQDNSARMRLLFADPDFQMGLRTPERIEVEKRSASDAAESGTWQWKVKAASGEVVQYLGRYLVMWSKKEGHWKIRSERYVSTGCVGGAACL
jgi:ketosteroid isomerase-like protein